MTEKEQIDDLIALIRKMQIQLAAGKGRLIGMSPEEWKRISEYTSIPYPAPLPKQKED